MQQPSQLLLKAKRHRKDRSVAIIHLSIHRYTMFMCQFIICMYNVPVFESIDTQKYPKYTEKEVNPLLNILLKSTIHHLHLDTFF